MMGMILGSSRLRAIALGAAVLIGVSGQAMAQNEPPPPEAGGPQNQQGPIALPKLKQPPPPPPQPKKAPEGTSDYSLTVNVPEVTVDALVVTKDGQPVTGLKGGNFRVFEDGVPQTLTSFNQTEAPITAVLLLEFAARNYYFMNDMFNGAYSFAQSLRPQDWVAVVSYDMKPHIITDFTQDKREVMGAIRSLMIPGFSETNEYDALIDTLDRVDRIPGRKYVILISSGLDTFSKHTFDQTMKKVKATPDVTIFTVATGRAFLEWMDARYGSSFNVRMSEMDFLQGENQLRTFAQLTGGQYYFPRFEAEMPEIFRDISATIRNQYVLTYHPTNPKQDGTYRKIKVEVVGPDGQPLKVMNQKGKPVKYEVVAREGYTAKRQVE